MGQALKMPKRITQNTKRPRPTQETQNLALTISTSSAAIAPKPRPATNTSTADIVGHHITTSRSCTRENLEKLIRHPKASIFIGSKLKTSRGIKNVGDETKELEATRLERPCSSVPVGGSCSLQFDNGVAFEKPTRGNKVDHRTMVDPDGDYPEEEDCNDEVQWGCLSQALWFNNLEPLDYVDDYYKVETCMKMHENSMGPINGKDMWPSTDNVPLLPPDVKKRAGRPKKARRREPEEPLKDPCTTTYLAFNSIKL
ncbi:hypothetical protein Vadar_016472 [Vaccinium darrowii]|uniref:Uncharacterized protein n=1 Tax=Vaccinium darrowii TaxID=229202 RepID=A0ACB7Z4J1_9ERIC|nr:hypothetical protein Vadar_016472 [Vaccinium darrowii]